MDYTDCNDDTLIFYLPAQCEFNSQPVDDAVVDRLVVDQFVFWMRFYEFTNHIFGLDFNWSNIIMAGDCVHHLLRHQYQSYRTDSIDLYLFGIDIATIVSTLETTINYLQAQISDSVVLTDSRDTIVVLAPHCRPIRLVVTTCVTPHGVIELFKTSYQRVGVTGTDVVYGHEFVSSVRTNTCTIIDSKVAIASINRADRYGYQITSIHPICQVYSTCIDYQVTHDLLVTSIDTTNYEEHDMIGTLEDLSSYYHNHQIAATPIWSPQQAVLLVESTALPTDRLISDYQQQYYLQFTLIHPDDIYAMITSRLQDHKTSRVVAAMCQIAAKLYEGQDMEHKLQQLLLINDIVIHAYTLARDREI